MPNNLSACRLCHQAALTQLETKKLLNRYDVSYYRCSNCDLIQTEKPYWLAEAYETALSALDTGCAIRLRSCQRMTLLIARLLNLSTEGKCLDFGGGHGIFVREMRDAGLNFFWTDKYASNDFAAGFEARLEKGYELITTFEVFEHLDEIHSEMETLFAATPRYFLVGTVLHQGFTSDWYYFSPETGQHIAFYSRQTMQYLAKKFGYRAVASPTQTLFIREDSLPSPFTLRLLAKVMEFPGSKIARVTEVILNYFRPYGSRAQGDYRLLLDRISSSKFPKAT